MSDNRFARGVLLSGIVLGLFAGIYMIFISEFRVGTDFRVYYYAASAAIDGENFYTVSPPSQPNYYFLYAPIVILFFLPYGLFETWVLPYILHTLVSITGLVVLSWGITRFIELKGVSVTRVDFALITAFLLFSSHSVPNILHGQINTLLAVFVGVGLLAHERSLEAWSGRLLGLAALIKVWPAIIGLWYLRNRSWTAVLNSIAIGVGGLVGGYLIFGHAYTVEFISILTGRYQSDIFNGGLAPEAVFLTIRRPLSHILPTDSSTVLTLGALLVLAPLVALSYQRIRTPTERIIAIFVTVAAVLLFFTSFLIYFPVLFAPLLVLMYVLEKSSGRTIFLSGAFIANFSFSFLHVKGILLLLPLPDQTHQLFTNIAKFILTYGTPTLYGILMMILGCFLYIHEQRTENPTSLNARSGRE